MKKGNFLTAENAENAKGEENFSTGRSAVKGCLLALVSSFCILHSSLAVNILVTVQDAQGNPDQNDTCVVAYNSGPSAQATGIAAVIKNPNFVTDGNGEFVISNAVTGWWTVTPGNDNTVPFGFFVPATNAMELRAEWLLPVNTNSSGWTAWSAALGGYYSRNLYAGANITIVTNGDGSLSVASTGGGGGGANLGVAGGAQLWTNAGQTIISADAAGASAAAQAAAETYAATQASAAQTAAQISATNFASSLYGDAVQLHTNNWFSYEGTNYFFPASTTACLKEIDTLIPKLAAHAGPQGISLRLDANADYAMTSPVTLTNSYKMVGSGNSCSGFTYYGSTNFSTIFSVMAAITQTGPYQLFTNTAAASIINFAPWPVISTAAQNTPQIQLEDLYFRAATNFPVILTTVQALNFYATRVAWYGPDALANTNNLASSYPVTPAQMSYTTAPAVVGCLAYVNTTHAMRDCIVYELAAGFDVEGNSWFTSDNLTAQMIGINHSDSATTAYPATNRLTIGFGIRIGSSVYRATVNDYQPYYTFADVWSDNNIYSGAVINHVMGGQAQFNGFLISTNQTTPVRFENCPGLVVHGVGTTGTYQIVAPTPTAPYLSDALISGDYAFGFNGTTAFNFWQGSVVSRSDPFDFGSDGSFSCVGGDLQISATGSNVVLSIPTGAITSVVSNVITGAGITGANGAYGPWTAAAGGTQGLQNAANAAYTIYNSLNNAKGFPYEIDDSGADTCYYYSSDGLTWTSYVGGNNPAPTGMLVTNATYYYLALPPMVGNGAGLTNLATTNLTGLVTSNQLAGVNAGQISGTVTNTSTVTNVLAAPALAGKVANVVLPVNVITNQAASAQITNIYAPGGIIAGPVTVTNGALFTGNGGGLTNLQIYPNTTNFGGTAVWVLTTNAGAVTWWLATNNLPFGGGGASNPNVVTNQSAPTVTITNLDVPGALTAGTINTTNAGSSVTLGGQLTVAGPQTNNSAVYAPAFYIGTGSSTAQINGCKLAIVGGSIGSYYGSIFFGANSLTFTATQIAGAAGMVDINNSWHFPLTAYFSYLYATNSIVASSLSAATVQATSGYAIPVYSQAPTNLFTPSALIAVGEMWQSNGIGVTNFWLTVSNMTGTVTWLMH